MAEKIENPIQITPIIKWAGGKKRLAPTIEALTTQQVAFENIDTYVEPFSGGAAFFLYLATRYRFKHQVIMDVNAELINLYTQVRDHLADLIAELGKLETAYNTLPEDDDFTAKKAYFYDMRTTFNNGITQSVTDEAVTEIPTLVRQAALFVFLNKTDFNGLYRVNAKGTFNVPFGRRKIVSLVDQTNLQNFSDLLQNTTILQGDYHQSQQFAGDRTFFYFDPPYRPLTDSASFTSYTKSSFNDDAQVALADFTHVLAAAGAHFALSNSDPHQSDPTDDFFDTLYQDFTINRLTAARMISARSKGRGNVSELLIVH
ncbi:LlaDCHIA [Levilactobacillus paucivorans]|uniref:site-specific DNA-methyltransferase (adenine-specific) n=1 Tax=Levilactobacillus paucivorans TaxID=616990 RepID=A0A0R2LT41_9LACO|nr:Dam family site-specific DNA-(adenine-N6)-methyltransferase [Levilactobacillus paucivorans]KRO04767.1 LlaDCHIA [Levilactobacillus paucivorans]